MQIYFVFLFNFAVISSNGEFVRSRHSFELTDFNQSFPYFINGAWEAKNRKPCEAELILLRYQFTNFELWQKCIFSFVSRKISKYLHKVLDK